MRCARWRIDKVARLCRQSIVHRAVDTKGTKNGKETYVWLLTVVMLLPFATFTALPEVKPLDTTVPSMTLWVDGDQGTV